jgi:hypothetical protein
MEAEKHFEEKYKRVVIMLSVMIIIIIGVNAFSFPFKAYFILISFPVMMLFSYRFFVYAVYEKRSYDLIGFILFTLIVEIGLGYLLF